MGRHGRTRRTRDKYNILYLKIDIIMSGVVPRLFKLPVAIASILGENLKTDGSITSMERQNATVTIKKLE